MYNLNIISKDNLAFCREKNLQILFKLYSVLKYLKAISIYAQTQTVSPEKLDFKKTISQDFFFFKSFFFLQIVPKVETFYLQVLLKFM